MRKIAYITYVKYLWLLALLCLMACSAEDTPDDVVLHDPSAFFEPAADDMSEEAQMRREFQKRYGAYLLFNDTIQKRYIGTDVNGDTVYFVERLSLGYSIPQTAFATEAYSYDLYTNIEDKQAALEFLENHILTHVTGKLMPYSWLLCNLIHYNSGSLTSTPYAAAGQRAIVVSTGMLSRLQTEAQLQQYVARVLVAFLGQLAANNSKAFTEFFEISEGYYSVTFSASTDAAADNYSRSHGFLDRASTLWGNYCTPGQTEDLNAYATYLLNYDDEYIERVYADYPLVRQKWALFKRIITELGYVI